ncbi:FAD-dependent oxidoreductase [Polymorphobacter sp.]|uniref:FAD-dependent oxidoreductase n=1 Tax=Polymorphobacter sp. TaxID=1909290 RepID=UPI003F6FF452
MLSELAALPAARVWDVAVVGSGPAGMTVAVALARLGRNVLLLEGGDRYFTDESQEQYQGEVIGDHYFDLDGCRVRSLGGTSVHWSGWCRPFEAEDFDRRDYDSMAWWQIGRADLEPYRKTAAKMLGARDDFWSRDETDGLRRFAFSRSAEPTRFADTYIDELTASRRITLAMNSNLVGIDTDGSRNTGLTMADYKGLRRTIRARQFVMACGGIENSRLLMHFNPASNGKLVKNAATLGRYWMEHPHFDIGTGFIDTLSDHTGYYSFQPAELRRRGLLNCGLRVHQPILTGWQEKVTDLACLAPDLASRVFTLLERRQHCTSELRAAWEMAPRAANRIELDLSKRDGMGIPRVKLHWRHTEADHANMRDLALAYGEHLVRTNRGRIKLAPWVLNNGPYPTDDEIAGYHHIGGTRMSDRPETGIVDRTLKVFGQDNLYMAGSSVFPTGGHVNPTMTIVQLSLRLADHLNRVALA